MTDPTAPAVVQVEQIDRDAAAEYAAEHWLWSVPEVHMARSGSFDGHHLVQAFARHRLAALAPGADVRGAVIEECAKVAEHWEVATLGYQPIEEHLRAEMHDLAAAIRALDGGEGK